MTIGVHGNWKQELSASQDKIIETYFYDESSGNVRLDSVLDQKNIKGKIIYPGNYTAGIVVGQELTQKQAGWLIGVDYVQNKWDDYRFYGQVDPAVRDKWELRAGARPTLRRWRHRSRRVARRVG